MTPIDLPAIRQRADAVKDSRSMEASLADTYDLCDEVARLRELVRRAYLEGFRDGGHSRQISSTATPQRWWECSAIKKEV